ncbi:MAG: hypothetical protein NC910_02375 [Candidatus Omnitrophica bacterium]|nr:hypothetical protein [Candidatus Omnitrophota bacterium]
MSLKVSVAASVLLHMGLLAIRPPSGIVPSRETLHPLEISYIALSGKDVNRRKTGPPAAIVRPSVPDKPVLPAVAPKEQKPDTVRKQLEVATPSVRRSTKSSVADLPVLRGAGAVIPQSAFALVEYKNLIRQHLETNLVYPRNPIEGAVRLRLSIRPDGQLKTAVLLEASDPLIGELAVKGVQEAVPYPRCPDELKNSLPDLEFLIQYRLD